MNRKKGYADMEKYRRTARAQKNRYYGKTAFLYPGRLWTDDENELILAHEMPDSELSTMIQRSVGAIQVQRCKLKKLMEGEEKQKSRQKKS